MLRTSLPFLNSLLSFLLFFFLPSHCLFSFIYTSSHSATITSIGARSVWDPKMDASKSYVVQHLSDTDSLAHFTIRGAVSDRDAVVVTAVAQDETKGNVTYVASTSVEDALIPVRFSFVSFV
jgi:hypothetical protein